MTTDIAMDVPAAGAERKSWTRRLPLIIGALLVLTLATWGVRRWLYSRHHVGTDNAQVDGHITAIAPRIAGFIDRVPVEENQHVKAGDTLVVLDQRDLRVRLDQAEADLRNALGAATPDNGTSSQLPGDQGILPPEAMAPGATPQASPFAQAPAAGQSTLAQTMVKDGKTSSRIMTQQQLGRR